MAQFGAGRLRYGEKGLFHRHEGAVIWGHHDGRYTLDGQVARNLLVGGDYYIKKPVNVPGLKQKVSSWREVTVG